LSSAISAEVKVTLAETSRLLFPSVRFCIVVSPKRGVGEVYLAGAAAVG
jgi:hypothetical protein